MGKTFFGKLTVGLFVSLLLIFLVEGCTSFLRAGRAAMLVDETIKEHSHCRYDPDLGWSNLLDFEAKGFYGAGADYTTNSQGYRTSRGDHSVEIPEGKFRITFLGDSYTMGYGVDDDHTFAAQVQSLSQGIETINMGMGAYGVGQAYLWYQRDGVKLKTDLLVLSVIAHDFRRLQRDDFDGIPKPRLSLDDEKLVADNVPVPERWGETPFKHRVRAFTRSLSITRVIARLKRPPPIHSDVDFEAVRPVTAAILKELKRVSDERGQGFALVYLPQDPGDVKQPYDFKGSLEEVADEVDVSFIDLTPQFDALSGQDLEKCYRPDRHFTVRGNRLVAGWLLEHLRSRFPSMPR